MAEYNLHTVTEQLDGKIDSDNWDELAPEATI
jgi:hypothetical protein